MASSEKFCLRWNDFEANMSLAFRELRDEKDFFDVTLAVDDAQQVQAHKVILSACSPFFRNVLRRNPHQNPLLYLKGVKYKELLSVLNFMYQGEVNVAQEELNSFLAVAEELKVKGLTQSSSDSKKQDSNSSSSRNSLAGRPRDPPDSRDSGQSAAKRPRTAVPDSGFQSAAVKNSMKKSPLLPPPSRLTADGDSGDDDDIQEVAPVVKSEPREATTQPATLHAVTQMDESYQNSVGDGGGEGEGGTVALEDSYQEEGYDYEGYDEGGGYDDGSGGYDPTTGLPLPGGADGNKDLLEQRESQIIGHILRDTLSGGGNMQFRCRICQFGASSRHKVFCHIEAKHFQDSPVSYSCRYCTKTLSSRNALGVHMSRNHRGEANNSIFPKAYGNYQ